MNKKSVGRPRNKKSKTSLGGMGLTPEEDKKVLDGLERLDLSLKQVQRALFRQWLDGGAMGVVSQGNELKSLKSLSK